MSSDDMKDGKQKHSVLVVEDAFEIRKLLEYLCTSSGFGVHGVANGLEALHALQSLNPAPSVILLDLLMPTMNGYEFLAEFRKNAEWQKIPILVMSAQTVSDEKKQTDLAGLRFLKKPLDIDQVLEALDELILTSRSDCQSAQTEGSSLEPSLENL